MSKKLVDAVNVQVANWSVLYFKLHHYHWFLKGKHFFELHVKFEELYNEAALHLDEIAERLLASGAKPLSTMKEYLNAATLKEASGKEKTEEDMLNSVIDDFTNMAEELKETISLAEEAEDMVTADMLTEVKQSIEKHVWMFKAFLDKD